MRAVLRAPRVRRGLSWVPLPDRALAWLPRHIIVHFLAQNKQRKNNKNKNFTQWTGFEPARGDPNGFLGHRLNHSATTAAAQDVLDKVVQDGRVFGALKL